MDLNEKADMIGRLYLGLEQIEECAEFSALIPEVRTNFVYASREATSPEDVLAVDGRISVVDGFPAAIGKIKFGASGYMARVLLEIRKKDPEIRSIIDFANSSEIADFLKTYCKEKRWDFSVVDRSQEPENLKDEEGEAISWMVEEAIRAAGGKMPRIFYVTGAVGKEPVSILVGKDPVEVAEQMCELARNYHALGQKTK